MKVRSIGYVGPSSVVLKRLHGVLFQRTHAERVMPVQLKVPGWRKDERRAMVIHGVDGPGRKNGGGTIRTGGRVPEGAGVEYAYRAGYDGYGRLSVTHVVAPGYSSLLMWLEAA